MTDLHSGDIDLLNEQFSQALHNIVEKKPILKNLLVTQEKTSAATDYFYQESAVDMTAIDNIPKFAQFPSDRLTFVKVPCSAQKIGLESTIS